MLVVYYGVAISGASTLVNQKKGANGTSDGNVNETWGIVGSKISSTLSGIPDSTSQVNDKTLAGLNVTFPYPPPSGSTSSDSQLAESLMLVALGFIPYVGFAMAAGTALAAIANYMSTGYPSSTMSAVNGNGTLFSNLSFSYPSGNYSKYDKTSFTSWGQNVIGSDLEITLYINVKDFSSPGLLTISGSNYQGSYWQWDSHEKVYGQGANTSLGIPLMPAYTISGTAYNDGTPGPNHYVEISQSSPGDPANPTIFYVKTNSTGYFRFFASPWDTYGLSLTADYGNQPTVIVNAPDNEGGTNINLHGNWSTVQGYVKEQNGAPYNGARVVISNGVTDYQAYTNYRGYYDFNVGQTGSYTITVYTIYNTESATVDMTSYGSTYTSYFTVASSSGGGCVLSGTMITLANGSLIPVQDLKVGDHVLSFDVYKDRYVNTKVTSINVTNVTSIVDINNGELYASGLSDQPIYVKLANGEKKFLPLGDVNSTMELYDNGTWIPLTGFSILNGHFKVFDVNTKKAFRHDGIVVWDYMANGFLLDRKI